MDRSDSEENDSIVDLESGETTSEEDGVKNLNVSSMRAKKGRLRNGHIGFDKPIWDTSGFGSSKNLLLSGENLEILVGEVEGRAANMAEMKMEKEKRKKMNSNKPPKPPRPPNGPLLDAADMNHHLSLLLGDNLPRYLGLSRVMPLEVSFFKLHQADSWFCIISFRQL
ncbi:hypothetical protein CMV_002557 [Castanea mollissima]|uniref:Uncharacterized protein n=1 Tax=Castanea mollissima TaxID=60419 RepID=A0A8J4S203_9ROSI|nr:hypothetical protein CMV_002557 [Castanea mollissima]